MKTHTNAGADPIGWHGTTILCVRRDGHVTMAGDGQVTISYTAPTTCSSPVISGAKATVTCPVGINHTWTVPSGVTFATFDVQGGGGGVDPNVAATGAPGGHARATLNVVAGQTYAIDVGGRGGNGNDSGKGNGKGEK